jgi:serine/threonine-protein kinase
MLDADPRLVAALADHYRIERKLGAGGMATVYLARDLRHDRNVALKVLRPELAAVIGGERFLAEIKTTAALQHPHILPLFDSGQADNFLYYVMPLSEGESLRDRLNRERQLPVEDVIRLGKEIGSALDYAHRHGVIHRDIKPENIMLHDGAALVADFGIALAVSTAGGNRMTETGLSLGTPGYMSPEQATGERVLDARADVYSLGCLLYEMLVGEPPHTGPTIQAVIAAVVTKDPELVSDRRPSVPPNVEAAVHKALAKLPADRFATAEAFVRALSEPGVSHVMTAARRPPLRPRRRTTARLCRRRSTSRACRGRDPGLDAAPVVASVHEPLPDLPAGQRGRCGRGAGWPHRRLSGRTPHRVHRSRRGQHAALDKGARPGRSDTDPRYRRSAQPRLLSRRPTAGLRDRGRTVRILSLEGGSPLTLTDSANTTAVGLGRRRLRLLRGGLGNQPNPRDGGHVEQVYKFAERVIGAEWPTVLAGGKGVLFRIRHDGQTPADFEIVAQPLPKGEARVLLRGVYGRYSPTGHLIVVTSDGKLLAVPFDPGKLALTGPPVSLYEGLQSNPFAAGFALSPTGTLIYETASQSSSREVVWVTRDGVVSPVDPAWKLDGTVGSIALSPNGKAIAVELQRNAKADIWVKQVPAGHSPGSPSGIPTTSVPPGLRTAPRYSSSAIGATAPASPR